MEFLGVVVMHVSRYVLLISLLLAVPVTNVSAQDAQVQSVVIQVDGLSCPFCAYGLEKHLKKVAGVERVDINMKDGQVIVRLKPETQVDDAKLKAAVTKAGFTSRAITRQ